MESIQKEILHGLLVDWGVGGVATFSARLRGLLLCWCVSAVSHFKCDVQQN